MGWTITIAPLLPWALIFGLVALCAILVGLMIFARARGVLLRVMALGFLAAALLNPSIRNEERDALTDIAVAVIDRSLSQDSGNRTAQTSDAEQALKAAAARLPNTELRIIEVRSGISADDDGTRAFDALNRALADIPPERFAGALMVTDGQVHDAPADLTKLGLGGPVHGLISGSKTERDRKVVIDRSPRFGIVGKDQTILFHVEEVNGENAPVEVTVRFGKGEAQTLTVTPGASVEMTVTIEHGGQNIAELSVPDPEGVMST